MTRQEHMRWCKARALAYLPGNPQEAFASMASDLDKHEGTANLMEFVAMSMMIPGVTQNAAECRKWIEGFAE
jgi:hypothetical protein